MGHLCYYRAMKQLIFIDDSGDPGLKSASSLNFVMAAAVFVDPKEAASLSQCMSEYRKKLGWNEACEFKFAKDRKIVIKNLLHLISRYDFQIYTIYVDKSSFQYASPIVDKEKLYNWGIKELLKIIPIADAKITIDGRSSRQNMHRTATYLRREINNDKSKKVVIKFEDSVDNNLIQLADVIAGSINRYLNANKTDYTTYINIVKSKIRRLKRIDGRA